MCLYFKKLITFNRNSLWMKSCSLTEFLSILQMLIRKWKKKKIYRWVNVKTFIMWLAKIKRLRFSWTYRVCEHSGFCFLRILNHKKAKHLTRIFKHLQKSEKQKSASNRKKTLPWEREGSRMTSAHMKSLEQNQISSVTVCYTVAVSL